MKLIIFDTETNCLEMNNIEIWQFSGRCYDFNTQHIHDFNYRYKTKEPISYNARVRCKITQEQVMTGKDFDVKDILNELYLNEDDVYYVGHNVGFDKNVLINVLNKCGIPNIEVKNLFDKSVWIDTLRLAKQVYNEVEVTDCSGTNPISFSLEYLFHYLHLYDIDETLNFHDANFDVEVTFRLLKFLCNELKLDIKTELPKIVDLSNTPVMISRFAFGKHKGELIKDVIERDLGYIRWIIKDSGMCDQDNTSYSEDMLYTLERLMDGAD